MEKNMANLNAFKNMQGMVDKDDSSSVTAFTSTTTSTNKYGEEDANDLVEGWEHDPKKMEIKFQCSVLNWKGHLPKRKEDILKIYAYYKQATIGDAPGEEDRPFETNAKEKWEVWNKWRGTPKDVAKRRYITYLRNISEKLVKVSVNERPPFGFPKELRSKKPICARCNSKAGCLRPLVHGDVSHYVPVPIKNELLDDDCDPTLYEYENLKKWFEHHEENQQCKWGLHMPIKADEAQPFIAWFNRPDVMGFVPYKKQKLIHLLKEVLHKQLEILYARQVDYKEKQENKNKKLLHLAHERLNVQTDRVLGMQYFHKEVTGEEYTFEVPCLRTSKHCNTRRMASSGKNHTHPLEIVRPETDYSYYERAVALRQETVRMGMPASTGKVSNSEERTSILAGRIAEFHRRQAGVMEAKLNQLYRDWRHPQQRKDVLTYSEQYVKEQLEDAINSSNCEMMATIISRGAPPDYETRNQMTALIKCTIMCDRAAIKLLVKYGADVNKFSKSGYNALMWAAKRDDLIMIHDLLDMGASPGMEGPTGLTAAMVAARHDRPYALEVICDHVLRNDDAKQLAVDRILNTRSIFTGKTPLMICAEARMFGMCRTLCTLGARTDIANFKDYTASTLAYHKGWKNLGEWLQKTRAIGPNGIKTYSDKTGEKKERLATGNLKKAVESGNILRGEEGMKLGMKLLGLEDKTSSSRATTPKSPGSRGGSPSRGNRSRTASREKSPLSPSSPTRNRSPSPTRQIAVAIPQDKQIILDNMMQANDGGVPEYLSIIYSGDAPPDTEVQEGMTAMIRASMEGNVEVVKILIKQGADVNHVNKKGQSALMWAAGGCGTVTIGVILLKEGANFKAKDTEGLNAQAYATDANNEAFGDLLMAARMKGAIEAVRQIENPTQQEQSISTKEQNANKTALLLEKFGATPLNVDDGDYDSWKWRLPGIVNRENVEEEEQLSSDDTDEEEYKRRNSIGDRGVVKVRCCKCTLNIPCSHYKTFNDMWQDNPGGVGYKWGLRSKKKKKKRADRPETGLDWRSIQATKQSDQLAKKDNERKMEAAFKAMDVNGDGSLSKMEVKVAVCNNEEIRNLLGLPHMATDEFDIFYSKIDLDDSLAVTYDEFHTYFAKQKEEIARELRNKVKEEQFVNKLKAAYKMVDLDGDGDVSKTEMLMAIQSNYKIQELLHNKSGGMSEDEFEVIYKKIDRDGSNSIEFEEFQLFFIEKRIEMMNAEEKKELEVRKAFNLIDVDQSGSLSRAELLTAMNDNVRIQSLLGFPKGSDNDDFNKLYSKIDKDGSEEIDYNEFVKYFNKLAARKKAMRASMGAKGFEELDSDDDDDEEPSPRKKEKGGGGGYKSLKRQKTKKSLKLDNEKKKAPAKRHAYLAEMKKKKKKKVTQDEYDNGEGEAMDMYGYTGERGMLLVEDRRIMEVRRTLNYTGLNCDFSNKRYRTPRCVNCHVGYSHVLLMPENRSMCDRCVLQRYWDTQSFCRLVPVQPTLYDAAPKNSRGGGSGGGLGKEELERIKSLSKKKGGLKEGSNEIFVLPDELNLVSFFVGQRRYAEAERILNALIERQTIALQNNNNKEEDVAIGFTLRTFAGYEEARGRLPFARAYRENSLDVIAAALGPTHKETLLAIDLYCGSMMKQGYFEEAVAFYRSIILQFEDSKISDRRDLAITLMDKIDTVIERRETELMEREDELGKKIAEMDKPGFVEVVGGESIEQMEKMLTSDEKWDRKGSKNFRHCCKLLGCFNVLRFYLAIKEFKALRVGEAGYIHYCRRIFKDFILEKDMIGFVDNETRSMLQDLIEKEKVAPPKFMYDELLHIATHDLFEKGWCKFLNMESGINWYNDSNLMKSYGPKVVKCQAVLRMILAKREINLCAQYEIPMREFFKMKEGDKVLFGEFIAERGRIFKICDDLRVSITEYKLKFGELPPDKFAKWVKGRKLKISEAKALKDSMAMGKTQEKKRAASFAKKLEPVRETKGAFEVQFTIHNCKDLKKADMFGKSDPVVLLKWEGKEVGRTSVISKNLNPDWGKWKLNSVWVEGELDKKNVPQCKGAGQFVLEVYDVDQGIRLGDFLGQWKCITILACDSSENRIFKEDKKLGEREKGGNKCVGGTVNVSLNCTWVLGATKDSKKTMSVTTSEGEGAAGEGGKGGVMGKMPSMTMPNVKMPKISRPGFLGGKKAPTKLELAPHFNVVLEVCKAVGLAKADMFGKSDPCARIMFDKVWDGDLDELDRSHIVNKDLNPVWNYRMKKCLIPSGEDGKLEEEVKKRTVVVEVYDCDARMLGDFLGQVTFNCSELMARKGENKVAHALGQKEGAKKKSKLVKGEIFLSVEVEFKKGRSEEEYFEDLDKEEEAKKLAEEKQLAKDLSAGGFSATNTFEDDYLDDENDNLLHRG